MYLEIYVKTPDNKEFHGIVEETKSKYTDFNIIKVFKNTKKWCSPIGISGSWIVKEYSDIKRKYPEYFI